MATRELQVGDRVEGQFGPGVPRKGTIDSIEHVSDENDVPTDERTGMCFVLVDGRGRMRGLLSSLVLVSDV